MAACLLAEGRHVLVGRARTSSTSTSCRRSSPPSGPVSSGSPAPPGEPGDLVIDTPAALGARGALRARREDAGLGRRARPAAGPHRARPGCRCPAATTSATGPSTSTSSASATSGAAFTTEHGYVVGPCPGPDPGGRLVGSRVVFEYPSHTATDNVLMAAVLAKGTTVHRERGARARGAATWPASSRPWGRTSVGRGRRTSRSRASTSSRPPQHRVIPDRVVAATFLAAVGLAGGDVVVEDARADHMDMLLHKLGRHGHRR